MTIIVKPVARLTPELRNALRQHKAEIIGLLVPGSPVAPAEGVPAVPTGPTSAPIRAYVATLGALWALGAEGSDADRTAVKGLLGEVARQCDELGAEFAPAVSRHAARDWSAREGRCAYCAMPGLFHDPDTGEDLHLGTVRS